MANWASHLMRSTDSKSLWNFTLSPGWEKEELAVLRLSLMKYGVGKWQDIQKHMPGKTVAQLNLQTQRLFGQQSLGEFAELHIDPLIIHELNDKIQGPEVKRKNGCIVNTGSNMTPDERRAKQKENQEKYGLTPEQIAAVEIPSLTIKPEANNKPVMPPSADEEAMVPLTKKAKTILLEQYYERLHTVEARLKSFGVDPTKLPMPKTVTTADKENVGSAVAGAASPAVEQVGAPTEEEEEEPQENGDEPKRKKGRTSLSSSKSSSSGVKP